MAKKRRRDEDYEDEDYREESGAADALSTVVPFRNPLALFGYYLGVFSLIPFLGLLLGPIAVILGIVGFVQARSNDTNKGTGHALAAVILGLGGFCVMPPVFGLLIWWLTKK